MGRLQQDDRVHVPWQAGIVGEIPPDQDLVQHVGGEADLAELHEDAVGDGELGLEERERLIRSYQSGGKCLQATLHRRPAIRFKT